MFFGFPKISESVPIFNANNKDFLLNLSVSKGYKTLVSLLTQIIW